MERLLVQDRYPRLLGRLETLRGDRLRQLALGLPQDKLVHMLDQADVGGVEGRLDERLQHRQHHLGGHLGSLVQLRLQLVPHHEAELQEQPDAVDIRPVDHAAAQPGEDPRQVLEELRLPTAFPGDLECLGEDDAEEQEVLVHPVLVQLLPSLGHGLPERVDPQNLLLLRDVVDQQGDVDRELLLHRPLVGHPHAEIQALPQLHVVEPLELRVLFQP
mmetsp:Transcript_77865/g.218206  ORF Transcript_77865/g.218206 Transcript_77865/m.218206 type:complete len:217 (+) Transcript_77865:503-1153(+)